MCLFLVFMHLKVTLSDDKGYLSCICNWSGLSGSQRTDIYKVWRQCSVFLSSTIWRINIAKAKKIICMYSFPAQSWIKGTDARREAAPASEIHPVTYGTGLPLRFFPSDTVNEGIFSFPRMGEMRLQNPPPPLQNEEEGAHSSISAKTSASLRLSLRPRFTFDQPNVQSFLFLSLHSEVFWFERLYVFHWTFHEAEAQTGVYCLLNPLEFIVYLCFMAACIDHSASKFHVCVCVSV